LGAGRNIVTKKIAVCFFGITRSLTHTIASIEQNVLVPARKRGDTKVYAHFFQQRKIEHERSGESGTLDLGEHQLLPSEWLQLEQPDLCLEERGFSTLKTFGDSWNDGFASLRNLVHQLHSLDAVTTAALADGSDICVFCRPDLRYHDSLRASLRQALHNSNLAQLPRWQAWGGLNDRFAICSGPAAISAYGHRIRVAEQFCRDRDSPLHSEQLVQYALQEANVPVRQIRARASRVRLGGIQRDEDFRSPISGPVMRRVMPVLSSAADKLRVKNLLKRLIGRV
jgi:hypothetical protein